MAPYPLYVEHGGKQVFRQPLALHGASLSAFLLDGKLAALQALCDAQLNQPARGKVRFEALSSKIMLVFAQIDRACSADPRDRELGWMSEIDVAFWVPVAVLEPEDHDADEWDVVDVAWFLPYLWVDNAWAMASGREIYGFPKEIGQFSIPTSRGQQGAFAVSTMVLDRHHPTTRAQVRELLEVRREGGFVDQPGLKTTWAGITDALEELFELVAGTVTDLEVIVRHGIDPLDFTRNVLDHVQNARVPMVFLKQFRDAADPSRACYQSVIGATAKVMPATFAGGGPLLGDYELTLADHASHPIAKDLGLTAGKIHVDEAFWLAFSFTMEAGRALAP
jgi:hypothetical protein